MSIDPRSSGPIIRPICCLAAICLTISLFAAPPAKKDSAIQIKFVAFEGRKRSYYQFIPDGSPAEAPAPLIVLLHGSGEDGLSLADPWRDLASKEGIILVAPNSADKRVWDLHADHPEFIREIIEAVQAQHAVDFRRLYLFGHSAGGFYALTLSMLESEYFAAAAVHAGALRVTDETVERAGRKIPIALWSETEDRRVPSAAVRMSRDILQAQGFPVELHELLGKDHNYYSFSNEVNTAAWAFLRQHVLEDQPKFQPYGR